MLLRSLLTAALLLAVAGCGSAPTEKTPPPKVEYAK
jgi:predicted small lipoprotein YifL